MATSPEMAGGRSLRQSAVSLALAGGIEYGLQLALPIILVRCLDETAFGQYRLLWLLAGTALAIAPAFMPQSLFYFLSRAEPGQKRVVIGNVLLYLIAAGCAAGAVSCGWNPWLQEAARDLFFQTHGISALFLAVWIAASMLDVLPTADGRARWQANAMIVLAVFRTLLLTLAALLGTGIVWLAAAMLAAAVSKMLLLAYYVRINAAGAGRMFDISMLKRQLAYAWPFALGNGLFMLRVQADQWVVITMLSPALYAMFSIASVVLPIASLIRQPVNNAMMPHLNHAHARGDGAEVGRLIARSNGATALLLIPIAGVLLVAAPELVQIVYTSRYQEAAPIMQVYVIGMTLNAFAVGHVLSAIGKGRFSAVNSACCLIVSIVLSVVGVHYWGLIGAAIGSVLSLALGELWALRVVAREIGMKTHQLLAWNSLLPTVLGTSVAVVGVFALARGVNLLAFPMVLFKGATYLILFAPCFMLAGGRKQLVLLTGREVRREAV